MAVEYLSKKNDDGTSLSQSASDKTSVYGVDPVIQADHIADVTEVTASNTAELVTDLAALEVKFNTLLDDLSDFGIHASS